MALKEMRRLEPRRPDDAFQRAAKAGVRAFWLNEEQFRALQSTRPELVVTDERGVLAGQPRGSLLLHFAFDNKEAFLERFPEMFERLAAAVQPEEVPPGIFIRFADRPARPYVEPVLFAHLFSIEMDWLEMYIPELQPPAEAEPPSGYVIREAREDDAEALMQVEAAAFPRARWTAGALQQWIRAESPLRVAVAPAGEVAGYTGMRMPSSRAGVITDVAVAPDYRRGGLGRALTARALRDLHARGARSVSLSVASDNGAAIALYRSLGFRPGQGGVTYRRPADPAELARLREETKGTFVKFGGWR